VQLYLYGSGVVSGRETCLVSCVARKLRWQYVKLRVRGLDLDVLVLRNLNLRSHDVLRRIGEVIVFGELSQRRKASGGDDAQSGSRGDLWADKRVQVQAKRLCRVGKLLVTMSWISNLS
jgi:hypothetical protein